MKIDISIKLGKRIKELREARGLSQATLAEQALKSVETISNFERGKTTPSVLTLDKLAQVLKVEVKDFFDFSNSGKDREFDSSKIKLLSKSDQDIVSIIMDALCKRPLK